MAARSWRLVGVVAALMAVLALPVASARAGRGVRLSVLPLPRASLGSAARSLPPQRDSGVLSNKVVFLYSGSPLAPNRSAGGTPGPPDQPLGRLSGYVLDYGLGESGRRGVTEVWTSVDKYKTSADAGKGLAFWKLVEPQLAGNGLSVRIKQEKTAAVGSGRFADFVRYRAANIAPLFGLDEQFTEGGYEADVTVWAGTAAAAKKLAPRLAKKLDTRIKQALAGRLHAKPVKLPTSREPGPPPGGPDLAPLALQTTDLSGQATDLVRGYLRSDLILGPSFIEPDRSAVSEYAAVMHPAGQFRYLGQTIKWYATANQANFNADLDGRLGPLDGLDLSSLGDGAQGAIGYGGGGLGAPPSFEGAVAFSSGRLEDDVFVDGYYVSSAETTSQVKNIAQTMANKINAAGLGN